LNARRRATAFAPASSANLAVGFDILGHPLSHLGDRVTAVRTAAPGVRVSPREGLPSDAARNTASVGVAAMLEDVRPDFGIELQVEKGIPLGSGIGGSAASAVAGVVAANALLGGPFAMEALLPYALMGESVASGAMHGDNVAPALLGGLLLVRSAETGDVVRLPTPASIRCVIALPELRLDTREARAALPGVYPLASIVKQSANLAGLVAGLCAGDLALVGRCLRDELFEPHRAPLIPGFGRVQEAALRSGALGCSISGAGPALFAWCEGDELARKICAAMVEAFAAESVRARGWVSPVDGPGARVEEAA